MVDTIMADINIDIKLSELQLKLKEYKQILAVLEKDKDLRDSERERLLRYVFFYFLYINFEYYDSSVPY